MRKADKRPPKDQEPLASPAPSRADKQSIRIRRSSVEVRPDRSACERQAKAGRIGQRLLTPNEAAQFLGVSRRMVYTLMAEGSLSFILLGSRRRLDRLELEAFIEANRLRCGRSGR